MKRLTFATAVLAVLGLALLPTKAFALLELDIGFDPTEVCPGERVMFSANLTNVGDEDEHVIVTATAEFEGEEIGTFEGEFELAAGEGISEEIALMIPPASPPGTLVVTITATDSDGTVEDSAELTVLECDGIMGGISPRVLINPLRRAFARLGLR